MMSNSKHAVSYLDGDVNWTVLMGYSICDNCTVM